MLNKYRKQVEINSQRPDFRVFGDFLWGEHHNFDSDGNSFNPASRNWTELYMSSREIANEWFDINILSENPMIFEVSSSNFYFLNKVVYFLKKETQGETNETDKGLISQMGKDFNLEQALKRAESSIWRKSTLVNPYPNS